jgi:hypothetical protein
MTKQTINIGTAANTGSGDSLRQGAVKINANFNEIYSKFGDTQNIQFSIDFTTAPTNGQMLQYVESTGKFVPVDPQQGPAGPRGLTGTQGPAGIQGAIGPTGPAGPLVSRTTRSATTSSLTNGQQGNITITGFKGYIIYKISTTQAAWIRLYSSAAARSSDASRLEGEDPLSGSGVIAEVITTGSQEILLTPGTVGFNSETPPSSNIYLAVTNKSGSTVAISVTLTVLQLEA